MKKLLAKRVAKKVGVSETLANRVIAEFLKELGKAVAENERVVLRGFGSFYLKKLKGRVGRNPKTGEKVVIPERVTVRFKASSELLKNL